MRNYLEQTKREYQFLNQVANDILLHKFSYKILRYAEKFVKIEIRCAPISNLTDEELAHKINAFQNDISFVTSLNYRNCFCYFYENIPRYTDLFVCVNEHFPNKIRLIDPTYEELLEVLKSFDPEEFLRECGGEDSFIPEDILDYIPYNEAESKKDLTHTFLTNMICPRCGKRLYTTDVYGYGFTCKNCDENLYSFELKAMSTDILKIFYPMDLKSYVEEPHILDSIGKSVRATATNYSLEEGAAYLGWNLNQGFPESRILYEAAKSLGKLKEERGKEDAEKNR